MAVQEYEVIASIIEQTGPKPARYEAGAISPLSEFSKEVLAGWVARGLIRKVKPTKKEKVKHGNG